MDDRQYVVRMLLTDGITKTAPEVYFGQEQSPAQSASLHQPKDTFARSLTLGRIINEKQKNLRPPRSCFLRKNDQKHFIQFL